MVLRAVDCGLLIPVPGRRVLDLPSAWLRRERLEAGTLLVSVLLLEIELLEIELLLVAPARLLRGRLDARERLGWEVVMRGPV